MNGMTESLLLKTTILDEVYRRIALARARVHYDDRFELRLLVGAQQRTELLAQMRVDLPLYQASGRENEVFGVRMLEVDRDDYLEVVYA